MWRLDYVREASATIDREGLKPYFARFWYAPDGYKRSACTIVFWADKPGAAIQTILDDGNVGGCPTTFHLQVFREGRHGKT